jgi:hypothetical protein
MAWKYKRWRIRWQPQKRKFKKIRRDRQKSRKAHLRWKKNRGKMKQALRKARIKGRITQRKNKAKGIYTKLKRARKRWKNILKSDINLSTVMDIHLLSERQLIERYGAPEIEVDSESDIPSIIDALKEMKENLDMADYEDEETKEDYIDNAIDKLETIEDQEELTEEDEDFIEEVISFIEEFAEAIGEIEGDDAEYTRDDLTDYGDEEEEDEE